MAASSGRVLTLEDVEKECTSIRLRLEQQARSLTTIRPHEPAFMEKAKRFASSMFTRVNTETVLGTDSSEQTRQENKRKVEKLFNDMRGKLNKQEDEVKKSMDTLTPEQQEEVITFWTAFSTFFDDLMNWLSRMFNFVMDKIRAGFRIVKEVLKSMFKTFADCLKMIF